MKLYVGNLTHTMTDSELSKLFSTCGTVKTARIITDHYTRQSKNFGYVEMSSSNDGNRALETLNGALINDRNLIVKKARPRDIRLGKGW